MPDTIGGRLFQECQMPTEMSMDFSKEWRSENGCEETKLFAVMCEGRYICSCTGGFGATASDRHTHINGAH